MIGFSQLLTPNHLNMQIKKKTILKAIGGFIALLLLLLISLPYFFKDEIIAQIKRVANQQLNAQIDFSDVELSLLRQFPDLSVHILDLSITGKGTFEGVPLAQTKSVRLRIDLGSVFSSRRPLTIESILIEAPALNVLVLADGQANYDIVLPDTSQTADGETTPFAIALSRYAISKGRIHYEDHTSDLLVIAENLDHSGKGHFTESLFDLNTRTHIDQLSIQSGSITWLDQVRLDLQATLGIDLNQMRFEIKDNELSINALKLQAEGWSRLADDQIEMDLALRAPNNSFAELFSLVPGAFIEGYEQVRAGGTFTLSLALQGTYDTKATSWPAFQFELKAQDGAIHYPGMPLGISQVHTQLHITHPGGAPDLIQIDMPTFDLQVGQSTLAGKFHLRTPLSDPDLNAQLQAQLQLDDWVKAFPMEGVRSLSGSLQCDLNAHARRSQLETGRYDQAAMRGSFQFTDLTYIADDMPPVQIVQLHGTLQPNKLRIDNFNCKLGRSDLQGKAMFNDLLGWFAADQQRSGRIALQSRQLDLNEWMSESDEPSTPQMPTPVPTTSTTTQTENWHFAFDLSIQQLLYDLYDLRQLQATGTLTPQRLQLDRLTGRLGRSDFEGKGQLLHLMDFVNYNVPLSGQIEFFSQFMDYADLLPETTQAIPSDTDQTTPSIPNIRYDLTLKGHIAQFQYDAYLLSDLRSTARITEQAIQIDQFDTKIGRSDLSGHGTVRNYLEYIYLDEPVQGTLALSSQLLDADQLMTSEPSSAPTSTEESAVVEVPKAFAFDIQTRIEKLIYSGIPLEQVSGKLSTNDGELLFEDFKATTMGGQMVLSGKYSTQNIDQPAFAIKYKLQNLRFQEVFKKVATFRALAPIAQFIEGKFQSELIVEGLLNKEMFPVLSTLDAQGFLKTVDALIKGYPPLEQISQQLNVPLFRQLPLDQVEVWFEIQDGTAEIKPINYQWQDIAMQIKGKHRLDGMMDYVIIARIPRDKFETNPIGAQANAGLSWLEQQAAARGLPFDTGQIVKVRITLSGPIKQPKVQVQFLGFEGANTTTSVSQQAQHMAKTAIADQKEALAEEVHAQKDSLLQQVQVQQQKALDSLQRIADQKAQRAIEEVKEKAGKEVSKRVEETAKEVIGTNPPKEVEEIKDKLEKWNPFGKKDKKGKSGN